MSLAAILSSATGTGDSSSSPSLCRPRALLGRSSKWPEKTFFLFNSPEDEETADPALGHSVFPRWPLYKQKSCFWDSFSALAAAAAQQSSALLSAQQSSASILFSLLPRALVDLATNLFLRATGGVSKTNFIAVPNANEIAKEAAQTLSGNTAIANSATPQMGGAYLDATVLGGNDNTSDTDHPEAGNVFPFQMCDPRGRIPTGVQGKWCVADMFDSPYRDPNNVPGLPDLSQESYVGEARVWPQNKEYPLNNICRRGGGGSSLYEEVDRAGRFYY